MELEDWTKLMTSTTDKEDEGTKMMVREVWLANTEEIMETEHNKDSLEPGSRSGEVNWRALAAEFNWKSGRACGQKNSGNQSGSISSFHFVPDSSSQRLTFSQTGGPASLSSSAQTTSRMWPVRMTPLLLMNGARTSVDSSLLLRMAQRVWSTISTSASKRIPYGE